LPLGPSSVAWALHYSPCLAHPNQIENKTKAQVAQKLVSDSDRVSTDWNASLGPAIQTGKCCVLSNSGKQSSKYLHQGVFVWCTAIYSLFFFEDSTFIPFSFLKTANCVVMAKKEWRKKF
jgi:hypothetical protein